MCTNIKKLDSFRINHAVDNANVSANGECTKTFLRTFERVIAKEGMMRIIDKDSDTRAILAVEFWGGKNALLIVFSKRVSVDECCDHEADS